jgi:hypothetical protein
MGQQGPSGGGDGNMYNDNNPRSLIRQLTVHHGAYIDKIEILYDDGTVFSHGGGGGDHVDVFVLNKGDYLQGVLGTVGAQQNDGGPYVVTIGFISGAGISSPIWGHEEFGNLWTGTPAFQYSAPADEVITGFFGTCFKYVDSIGIFTAIPPS